MVAHPRQRLGDRRLWPEHDRLGRHQTTRGVGLVAEQPADGRGLLGIHRAEQLGAPHRRELAEQVRRVVGLHLVEHTRRLVEVEVLDDPHLLIL